MALALYRKYRPRTFAEVIGQQHVTEPLAQALRSGRLHHAYLFSGPRGCGKTSSARILARSLNCVKGPTPEPCGECESCVALAPDGPGSIDVIEIDAASHGGVDDARDLRERAFFAPAASRFKVYVIDEAHMVSPQGFNALLKLVEEPPEFVKFVFATTEPEKVLGTIRSRTHHYPFRLIPPSVLRPYLEQLCRDEGVSVEPAVFPLVVRAGGGSARDSLSVLDQLIAGAGVYGVTYARAVSLLGVTDVALIDEMTDALAAGDGATAFAAIDRVADAGHDPRRFASDLLERLRDIIIVQQVPDATATGIIEAPDDQLERMTAQAARMGPATVSRLADIVHNGLTEMRGTTAPRLLLELIVARMLLPGADDSHGALLQRLERMERRLGASSAPEPAAVESSASVPASPADHRSERPTAPRAAAPRSEVPASGQPTSPVSVPAAATQAPATASPAPHPQQPVAAQSDTGHSSGGEQAGVAGSLDAAAVRRVWDEVLTVVRRRSPRAWAVVREAMVRDVHGEEIVLVFQHAVHANMFGAQADLLVEAVVEVLGGSWRVQAELVGDQASRPGDAAPPPSGSRARSGASGRASPARDLPAAETSAGRTGGIEKHDVRPPSAGSSSAGSSSAGDGDWPTPARLGGSPESAATTATLAGGVPLAQPATGAPATVPSARKQARPKAGPAAGGRPASASPRGGEAPIRAAADEAWPDAPPPDEPPVDPEGGAPFSGYEGFDPGDEPLDDIVDASNVPSTREEQAIALLSEHLGAERIQEPGD